MLVAACLLGAAPVADASAPAPATPVVADLRGALFIPRGRGPFPVVLFQHGRHATCKVVVETLGPGCRDTPVTSVVPSYRGYDYLAENLASHGYLVMSVDANDVNDCLLYTSPSPRDLSTSRMPSSA